MARIFISHSRQDIETIRPYLDLLQRQGHELLIDETVVDPGSDFQASLMKALAGADGTLVFLTRQAIRSPNVNSEIGIARSYLDRPADRRFLIPLITPGVVPPYPIQGLPSLPLELGNEVETVQLIAKEIDRFRYETARQQPPEVNREALNDHYYSLDADDAWAAANGYILVGVAAYVPAESGVPVLQQTDPSRDLHFLSRMMADDGMPVEAAPMPEHGTEAKAKRASGTAASASGSAAPDERSSPKRSERVATKKVKK